MRFSRGTWAGTRTTAFGSGTPGSFGPIRVRPWGSRPLPDDYVSNEDRRGFQTGCETADASLRAAIKHLEDFGVYVEEAEPAGMGRAKSGGGVSQNFHGPVSLNQAIATGNAVQRIGQVGNKAGADLKEIADLLQQSQDLSPNQVRQGIGSSKFLSGQVELPEEKRNWKSVLERRQRVLELAGKAVDLGTTARAAPADHRRAGGESEALSLAVLLLLVLCLEQAGGRVAQAFDFTRYHHGGAPSFRVLCERVGTTNECITVLPPTAKTRTNTHP